jgi:hypothetical protein
MARLNRIAPVFALVAALSAAALPAPGRGAQRAPREDRRIEAIAPGVEREEIRRGDFAPGAAGDRWVINVLRLDPARVRLILARAMDEAVGTETVSSLARRHGAAAAVNGGYFRTTGTYKGEPSGLIAFGAAVWSEPSPRRAALAVTNAGGRVRAAVTAVDFAAAIEAADGASRAVSGVDRPREDGELVVYGPEFHRTTLTTPGGIEAAIESGRVAAVRDGDGSSPIPAGGWVVSASGAAADWVRAHLKPGATVRLRSALTADPPLPFASEFLLGAGPRLVAGGRAIEDPGLKFYPADFATTRHPRTAAGILKDGRIALVTVDGRQPTLSVGLSIPELAALMLELGCADAINLDGGGSTTMVAGGRIVNAPSDAAGERPVSDALLVIIR